MGLEWAKPECDGEVYPPFSIRAGSETIIRDSSKGKKDT